MAENSRKWIFFDNYFTTKMRATIKLFLDKKQKKKSGYPLVFYIYVNSKDKERRYTGYYSTLEDWDFTKEEPKRSHSQFIGIMDYLLEKRLKINKLQNSRETRTAKQIYEYLNGKDDDFYYFWTKRISELKESGQEGNAWFYETNLRVLQSYKSSLKFSEISYNFLTKFKLDKKKTCSNGGINTYLKAMRAIYNEAVRRGVFIPQTFISPFENIMEPSVTTKNKNLSIQEMKKIVEYSERHRFYDYFMIMFLLGGVDFIDITNLKKGHISNGRVKFTRFKGGTNEVIDNFIFPEAWEIIKKYEVSGTEYLFPLHQFAYKPYRDKFTRDFRKWLQSIGITSYFSSKSARYTFINIGKELLLNREVIMELTGHSKGDVHSIYESKFPNHIKDGVHRQILDAVLKKEAD